MSATREDVMFVFANEKGEADRENVFKSKNQGGGVNIKPFILFMLHNNAL